MEKLEPIKVAPNKEKEKYLKRAEYVVEQIERDRTDLTTIGEDLHAMIMALSVLGPEGKELFLRIAAINTEYLTAEDDWETYSAKNKYKGPQAFFTKVANYGLEVKLPKTLQEAKKEVSIKDIIGDEDNVEDFLKYAIYCQGGTYWSLDSKNVAYNISNFSMRILYHVETSDDEAYRLIEIKNIHGHTSVVKMNTDDFVSVGAFKKVVARKGNFLWKGNDVDLCRLQDKLQREERPTKLVKQLGWNRRNRFFAFANGIYCTLKNKFLRVDEYGIVEHNVVEEDKTEKKQNFFIPALSKIFAEKEDLFANDKKFVFQESKSTFKDWSEQYVKVYNTQGQMALVFYLMALNSDIVFRDLNKRFPLLFLYGKRGSGKGTLIASLMRLFGEGQDQLMLGGASTVVGFMRKFSQFSNAIVWLDEYKNNLKASFIESLKNIFDRIGYERGKKDNTFQTESTPIHSACILSGQEMPTIEPALFTRTILLSLMESKFTDEQRDNMSALREMEKHGLSGITVQLLEHREWFDEQFRIVFEVEQKKLMKEVNNNEIDERMFVNYAAMIATAEVLSTKIDLPFNMVSFRQLCKKNILEQFFVLKGSDDTSKFWDVVETLFTDGRIKENEHFQLQSGYVFMRVQDVYQAYARALGERKDPNVLDKETLYNYLENDAKSFICKRKKFFGGAQKWSMQFKYEEIGINLIKAESEDALRRKYKDMGIEFMPEEGIQKAMPFRNEKKKATPLNDEEK
jgi:hypothetical protein